MNCRTRGGKPALALWMLVAVVDIVLLAAAAGTLVTILIVTVLAMLAAGTFAARSLTKRGGVPAESVSRRRA
ncbi:MAG TPA: hypothetical protein VFG35_21375 [Actinoplanes sp.]|nr:hypothetical protein [Actinoplanes sp.]